MTNLRGFQKDLKDRTQDAWKNGARNVMVQLATGGGKTVIIGAVARDHINSPHDPRYAGGAAIAHRSELVGQISQQLAREEIPHDIIAPKPIIRAICNNHLDEFGRTFYNARAAWRVASVDTIIRRPELAKWAESVGLGFIDEAHHVLRENKWGKAVEMFPNARFMLPTATPIRADGCGLGAHSDGIADVLIEGPPMRWLIDQGYLTDYKVFVVDPSDLNLAGVDISSTGDFAQNKLREAVNSSNKIVGDVVATYIKHANGKLGVTFAVDVTHAQKITDAFNAANVPAALITANTPDDERRMLLRKFRNRELHQLVNVDLFGEGFDLPAIECVSFARPTASFALYSQQWGRALRLMISPLLASTWDNYTPEQRKQHIAESGKPFAYIFDHAGNFYRHEGPPDKPRVWSLDARERRSKGPSDSIPMRVCLNVVCAQPYEKIYHTCPYCGTPAPEPTTRGNVNEVDGDITEISPELLARYRGEIARIDGEPYVPAGVPAYPVIANHRKRQAAQHRLRETIAYWAGSHDEHDDRVNYRRFWYTFGIDVLAAQTLNERDATELREKILADLRKRNILISINNGEQHE